MKPSQSELAKRGCLVFGLLLSGLCAASRVSGQTPKNCSATSGPLQDTLEIPAGTVLPVGIDRGFSSRNSHKGQAITARIRQEVPLPGGTKIREGSKLAGTILSVSPAGNRGGGEISFRFETLEIRHQHKPIVVNLRALGSALEVQQAQIPEESPGFGTPYPWITTQQIGGDEVYGVGGPVTDSMSRHVGKGVFGGVLVHLRPQPEGNCRGPMVGQEDWLQALWVFSSDACGLYGMDGVQLAHAGRTEPIGVIVLASKTGNVNVRSGSGMLLRVIQ